LAEKLRGSDLFQYVEVPGSEAYFRRAGLLFLDPAQLQGLREQLRKAAPALTVLANQPDLLGIAKFIDLLTAGVKLNVDIPPQLSRFVDDLAETTRLQAAGQAATLGWSSLFELGELQERGRRRFVLAFPVLDKTTVKRVAPALDAARAAARAVSSNEAYRDVRIRMTGQPALDQQELDAAFSGALYASLLSFALVVLTLVIGIRSWRLIVILTVVLIVGTVWTSGLAAIAVSELNLISLAFGVLFFAIGVDFGTHLGLRYMEQAAVASPPQARWEHAMAYDEDRNVTVLFGGDDNTLAGLADTWEFDGTTWTPLSNVSAAPKCRYLTRNISKTLLCPRLKPSSVSLEKWQERPHWDRHQEYDRIPHAQPGRRYGSGKAHALEYQAG
jgi:hypothetical protein